MFVDVKFSTLKIYVNEYLKLIGNSVFHFSVSDFLSVSPGLTKCI